MAPVIFPAAGGLEALLYVYAFLPLKHVARPFGALFFGWAGDRWGRQPVLTICLVGMTLATIGIGFVPEGHHAALMLGFFCVAQGFFAAGEIKGAAIYLLENTAEAKRSWISSVYDASGIAGIFLASCAALLVGTHAWRHLFLFGALIGVIGALLRKDGVEQVDFKKTNFRLRVLWEERMAVFSIIVVSGFSYANYYLVTVFLNGILPQIGSISCESALLLNTHLLWVDFLLLFFFGALCKKFSREKIMGTAALLTACCAIPIFTLFEGASLILVACLRLMLVTFGVALAAPYHAWKLELLPKNHRFFFAAFASAIGSKFFGAPMPAIAMYLVAKTGWVGAAGLPLLVLGLLAAWCITRKALSY